MTWPAGGTPDAIEHVSRKTQFEAIQTFPPARKYVFEGSRPAMTIATNRQDRPYRSENALYKAAGDFLRGLTASGQVAPGLTLKGLNHTLGAALAELGIDPRTAKDAMQERTLATALHYSNRADTRRNSDTAMREMDRWLKGEHDLENSAPYFGKPEPK